MLPGDQVYVQHPKAGPMTVTVLATGSAGFTAECEKKGRYRVPYDHVLGHRARMLQQWTMEDQGADGAILTGLDGARRYMRGRVTALEPQATTREQDSRASWRDDDPLLAGLDRLGIAPGENEEGGETFGKAFGIEPRNPSGSAERHESAFHEAGHAVATFALDRLSHMHGHPLRQGVTDLEVLDWQDGETGFIARSGNVHRENDGVWALNYPLASPHLTALILSAKLEVVEFIAGTFAEARMSAGDFAEARFAPLVDEFRAGVLAGAPEPHRDEAKTRVRLDFIHRHGGGSRAAVLHALEEVTWAVLATEWSGVETVADALDRRGWLDGEVALNLWAGARLSPARREAEAVAASAEGTATLVALLEARQRPPPIGWQ